MLISLFLVTIGYSCGQECSNTFRGIIKDINDKSTIIKAVIQVEATEKYFVSDANGKFVINNLYKQDYWLLITHVSYTKRRIKINTTTNSFKEIYLSTDQQKLDEVTIKTEIKKRVPKPLHKLPLEKKIYKDHQQELLVLLWLR